MNETLKQAIQAIQKTLDNIGLHITPNNQQPDPKPQQPTGPTK